MTADQHGAGEGGERTGRPAGLRRHEEPGYGYAITVPTAFVALMNTVDPLARLMRQLDDKELDEESKLTGSWPVGFADAEVVGDIGEGHHEPLRLLEFDVLTRPDPLDDAQIAEMREAVRRMMPEALASRGMPGYELLRARDAKLGPLEGSRVRVRVGWTAGGARSVRPRHGRLGGHTDHRVPGVLPLPGRGVGPVAAGVRGDPGVVRAHRAARAGAAPAAGGIAARRGTAAPQSCGARRPDRGEGSRRARRRRCHRPQVPPMMVKERATCLTCPRHLAVTVTRAR